MKKALKQSVVFIAIIVFSFLFGFVFDKICLSVENRTHTADVPYSETIAEYCDLYNVDPAWIYALIKTETNFANANESKDGKIGVMALSRETFEFIKTEIIQSPDTDSGLIFNPETNVEFGIAYFAYLKSKYANEKMTVIAYLAGTDTTDAWLEQENAGENGMILKTIPDKTINKKTSRVIRHYDVYARVFAQNKKN